MLHPDGVEVFIKSLDRDEPYVEYTKPGNSEATKSKSVERWIEVNPRERFSFVVIFKENFDFRGQPHVELDYGIDDDSGFCHAIQYSEITPGSVIEKFRGFYWIKGVWRTAELNFAELILGEPQYTTPLTIILTSHR
jgi:hypothetical protein